MPRSHRKSATLGLRVFDGNPWIRVTASERYLYEWAKRWPCSRLGDLGRGVSFTYERDSGDLVDMSPHPLDGEDVVALSHDLWHYAKRRLSL